MELYDQTNQGSRVRLVLTDEELGLPSIDDLCDKYLEWLRVSKECEGRKTRSANRRADQLYDEIIAYKVPPIKLNHAPIHQTNGLCNSLSSGSVNSSVASDSSQSLTRSLRPRSRTPEVQNQLPTKQRSRTPELQNKRQNTTPSTPSNQRIRAHMKQASDGSSNVLSAAINQQHPSVSATKIRLALRADSAQKRHEEEQRERERLRIDRKAKEERAEAQKKQILEERAINAKKKREERLLHAAEVRKAREEARKLEKQKKEQEVRKAQHQAQAQPQAQVQPQQIQPQECQGQNSHPAPPQPKEQTLNETFKKPTGNTDNIEIIICDQSNDDQERVQQVAAWARAPYLRDALVKQFTRAQKLENLERFKKIIPALALPVQLEKIFGSSIGTRHIVRTSSAVWSPVHKSLKRSSSMVMTPDKS